MTFPHFRFYFFGILFSLTIILTCLSFGTVYAGNSIIHLHNGDRLSGTITSTDTDHTLHLQMNAGPQIRLNKDQIARIEDASPLPHPEQTTLPDTSSQKTIAATAAPTPSHSTAYVKKTVTDSLHWSGRIEFGGELQTGNSNTEALSFDTRLKARDKHNRYQLDFEYNRSEDEGTLTDDNRELGFNYQRFQSEKWFLGADISFENDDIAELDLRSRLGVESGYQFYDYETLSLRAAMGLAYLNENFANESTQASIAITQNIAYEQGFLGETFRVFYEHDLLLPTEQFNGFIFNSEFGLRVPVAKKLIGTAGIDFDWDNDPAEDVREDDVTYTLKIGYEF